jgi:ribonuclease HII
VIGIDEVGRGAWAGPLLVCAARLHTDIQGLKDSKLLSAKKRQEFSIVIIKNADIGYGWVSAKELDNIGLATALRLATERALTEIVPRPNEEIIIDGTINFAPEYNAATMIKADQKVPSVSAASIVAKVARDSYMQKLSLAYPAYGFDTHVGYGTSQHTKAINENGLCIEHRKSFKLKGIT